MRFPSTSLLCLGLSCLVLGCGRDAPGLYSVVRTSADAQEACLPLREPSLSALPDAELRRLRPATDHYAWLVGETLAGPTGMGGTLANFFGRSALVSLTSSMNGRSATRAVAAIEGGRVVHTYFGTPLTPAFSPEPGARLSVTFEARQVDEPSVDAARALLGAVPGGGTAYGKLLTSLAPAPDGASGNRGLSQTWVLRDPLSCDSGACRAVLVEQQLVLLSASATDTPAELASQVCLKGTRLFETGGAREYDGAYAVLRLAHARLPEEALGEPLADALATLGRCDARFTPELAMQARDSVSKAEALTASDREVLAALTRDAWRATRATLPEERLESEHRLRVSSERVCRMTPADGVVCARAKAIASCAAARARPVSALREAWQAAMTAIEAVERAGVASAPCDERATSLVTLARDAPRLASAVRGLSGSGACTASAAGLGCEAFPRASRRSKAAIAAAQDLLYRQCHCEPLLADAAALPAGRLIRQALRCEVPPESLSVLPPADEPVSEKDVVAYASHRRTLLPPLTAVQCPSCVRLERRIEEELSRAVMMGRNQRAIAGLLREALTPVTELHDRAFVLMSGETGVRCSQRSREWAVIVQALSYEIAPADLFRAGGGVAPEKLEARLKEATLLREALDGLSCARTDVADGAGWEPSPEVEPDARVDPLPERR